MNHRNILVCVSGMSPAIITETLYALVCTESPAFIPDEVHVITTLQGKDRILGELLDPQRGAFHQLVADYLPGHGIRFDADTVHVIGQEQSPKASPFSHLLEAPGKVVHQLHDITTAEENEAAANTIYRVLRELKNQPGTRLHASVAGGRKSMSFYMGHAFSLLADADDQLSHVLVSEPFELPQLKFYYPPREPRQICWTDRQGQTQQVSTAEAGIKLAHLSVLKLGALLGKDWPKEAQQSLDFAVKLAQAALEPPKLKVVLSKERGTDDQFNGSLELCDVRVDLSPLEFIVFALYALACAHQHDEHLIDGAQLDLSQLPTALWERCSAELHGKRPGIPKKFTPIHSHIQAALREKVGAAVAQHFSIEAEGKRKKDSKRQYALQTAPELLDVSEVLHWWGPLRKELT